MYEISDQYKEYLKQRSRDWLVKVLIGSKEYGNDVILDFVIENDLTPDREFVLGAAIVSKLTLRMKTSDEIAPNARTVPSVALTGSAGATEWLPLGEFFIDSREQVKDVWVFTCYDKLIRANVPYISALTYPATMQAVWDEICTSLGYTYDGSVFIDPSHTIQVGPVGFTKREMLGYIAAVNAASVYIAKNGELRFRRFDADDSALLDLTDKDYIRAEHINPFKTYTRIVVTYDTEQGLTYEAGEGDENHTLHLENPFMTQAMVDALLARLNGFYYTPAQITARGHPEIELGDRFNFGRSVDSPEWEDADIAWEDVGFTWNGYQYGAGISIVLEQKYTFRGGLQMEIGAPSKSEQESEFETEGTLAAQINRLNQTSVKLGRQYYGATITRDEGLIIEREDHASKVILNSDEFSFYVGADRALWFDIQAQRYKFSGTLEATDGVFTGALVGGTIEIGSGNSVFKADQSGIYLGSGTFSSAPFRVDLTGALYSTAGYIGGWNIESDRLSGNGAIEGGEIIGSYFYGGTINVSDDVIVGDRIKFNGAGGMDRGIYFGNVGAITFDMNTDTIEISSMNGVSISSSVLIVGTTDILEEINSLKSMLAAKATSGADTGYAGPYNGGIPIGTELATADGGTVTWVGIPAHKHIQN